MGFNRGNDQFLKKMNGKRKEVRKFEGGRKKNVILFLVLDTLQDEASVPGHNPGANTLQVSTGKESRNSPGWTSAETLSSPRIPGINASVHQNACAALYPHWCLFRCVSSTLTQRDSHRRLPEPSEILNRSRLCMESRAERQKESSRIRPKGF